MRHIVVINPGDRDYTRNRYILAFGAYGDTLLMAWANSLDDALDECIDWIADNAPGLLCDDAVAEEYKRTIAEGMSEEEAQEAAEIDTTCGGNCSHYINSWEWGIVVENPTREEILRLQGRDIETARPAFRRANRRSLRAEFLRLKEGKNR